MEKHFTPIRLVKELIKLSGNLLHLMPNYKTRTNILLIEFDTLYIILCAKMDGCMFDFFL